MWGQGHHKIGAPPRSPPEGFALWTPTGGRDGPRTPAEEEVTIMMPPAGFANRFATQRTPVPAKTEDYPYVGSPYFDQQISYEWTLRFVRAVRVSAAAVVDGAGRSVRCR